MVIIIFCLLTASHCKILLPSAFVRVSLIFLFELILFYWERHAKSKECWKYLQVRNNYLLRLESSLSPLSLSLCCVSPCTSASVLQETRLPKRTTFASMDIFGSPLVSSDIYA